MQGSGSAAPCVCLSSLFAFFCSLWLLSCCLHVAAVDHSVDWTLSSNYDTSGQSFSVGDTITFKWSGNHDVVAVSATNYAACASSSSDTKFTTSPAKITLTAPGTSYFICSVPGHCSSGGMKLSVAVTATNSSSAKPTSSDSSLANKSFCSLKFSFIPIFLFFSFLILPMNL